MIEPVPGWGWEVRQAGICLTPPGGEERGVIRYVERVRPLRRISEVAAAFPTPAGYQRIGSSSPEALITEEGEYAAQVTCRGRLRDVIIEHFIACVFVDDFYALIAGVATDPEQAPLIGATVRSLALSDRHYLGARRRRFVYRKPATWHGVLDEPYHGRWFAPDHPRSGGMLVVPPAMPLPGDVVASRILVGVGAGDDYRLEDGTPIRGRGGLSGRLHTVSTARELILVAVLDDPPYTYPVVLRTRFERRDEHERVLMDLVRSIEALPRGAPPGDVSTAAFQMWVD